MDQFSFTVCDKFQDIEFSQNERASFNEPSGLTLVRLLTHWWDDEYQIVDFTGTTKRNAIIGILSFYEDPHIRANIGDHIFYEGFHMENGMLTISLGS